MKKNAALISAIGPIALISCAPPASDAILELCAASSLAEVQTIGSHNSYRRLPPSSVMATLDALRPGLAERLEYEHPDFETQLNLGLRLLEIDIYADPVGGVFSNPPILDVLAPGDPVPYPPADIAKPGFKVMHIQGYDNYSHCLALEDCLEDITAWSAGNPNHAPIFITLNVKEDQVFEGLPEAPRFTPEILDQLDAILIEAFGRDRLLTPDDVRGDHDSLRQAVREDGWPRLAALEGRFIFALDEARPSVALRYRENHPSLAGRVMFAPFGVGEPENAFFSIWNIQGREAEVRGLVEQGFLVRVAADIGTQEARANDRSRLNAAIASGAQFISTDYYPGHISPFETDYEASFGGGRLQRCGAR